MARPVAWIAVVAVACHAGPERAQEPAPPADEAGHAAPGAGAGTGGASGGHTAPVLDAGSTPRSDAQSGAERDAGDASAPEGPPDLSHVFPELTIAPGEERTGLCQSWTLGNEEPLYVNRVVATNRGGLHHSNWIWVTDASYPGPDGTWPCAERGFEQILAGAVGGVFFAQSTQSEHDTQAFPEGAAFEMPPHARIIGDVHLLNPRATAVNTEVRFDLYTLPESEVRVKLSPMAFTNTALEIAAGGETSARMECAVPQPDFDVYYVLPHYHVNGRELRITVAGGPMDGMAMFTSQGMYGEPLGQTFDPPIAVRGARGLAITCDYTNPSDAVLRYGFGDQEMCVVLIYSTGKKAGGTALTNFSITDVSRVHRTDALCLSVGAP